MFGSNWESNVCILHLRGKSACSSASLCVQTVQRTASGKAEEVTGMRTGRTKWGSSRCLGGWGDPRDSFVSPLSRRRPNILSWWWSTTTKWWVEKHFCNRQCGPVIIPLFQCCKANRCHIGRLLISSQIHWHPHCVSQQMWICQRKLLKDTDKT